MLGRTLLQNEEQYFRHVFKGPVVSSFNEALCFEKCITERRDQIELNSVLSTTVLHTSFQNCSVCPAANTDKLMARSLPRAQHARRQIHATIQN